MPAVARPQNSQNSSTAKSVAVLPFVNMSSDPENEYLSDGITEEIINALSKVQHLRVTSRTSSFFFKSKSLPVTEIGRQLNVVTVLEGSVRVSGNRVRISAQLVDIDDDYQFWSETFDRSLEDIFALQDEISLLIADRLREQLGHLNIDEKLVEAPNVPLEAYKKYLKSRYLLLKMTKTDLDRGMEMLQEIIDQQPSFALAHLGMHLGYTLLGTIGLIPGSHAFEEGQPFLDRAIAIDPDLPECQLHLAWDSFLQDWNVAKAYQHLSKALAQRPVVDFYQTMASILVAEGKTKATFNYLDTATQIDPLSAINYHLKGFTYYTQEKYQQAIEQFQKSIQLKADFTISNLYWGQSLLLSGQLKQGLAFFQNLPDDEQGDILKLGGTTLAHAALGNTELASEGIQRLKEYQQTDLIERAINLLILCYAFLRQEEEMYELIEKGIALRLPMMVYVAREPILKPWCEQARFKQLMQQILGDVVLSKLPRRRYKQTLLSDTQLSSYHNQLELLMQEAQPFLDPNLTLRDLAQQLSVPPNQMSQLLNEGFGKNFAEYVNIYRLEAFKKKLKDPASQHLTLLGIAYDCGFNSKTVFNTFFKKATGKTPSAYWKETTIN